MSDTVISVENVTKSYRLGQIGGGTLKADAARWLAMLRGKPDPNLKIGEEHLARHMGDQFWALDDVSFEVKEGEVLGIIGRNGAGKSTLLKILSQVTTPTSGQIKIKGRIASLLEVGTGFNPEMTGRENVFLNGAILGMTKAEIRKKFDEIVAFSEIEEFIDTPVKRYSSGMYVRLAFAVAAHLEPEILIIDEVLAVGDAAFQNKCIGKMQNVSRGGRTVLFVSHNIQTVRQLCTTTVFMANGQVSLIGNTTDAIARYLGNSENNSSDIKLDDHQRNTEPQNGRFQLIQYRNQNSQPLKQCDRSQEIHVRVVFKLTANVKEFDFAMAVTHAEGIKVFSETLSDQHPKPDLSSGTYAMSFIIPAKYLKAGSYSVALCALYKGKVIDFIDGIPAPEIIDRFSNADIEAHRWGLVRIPVSWLPLETL